MLSANNQNGEFTAEEVAKQRQTIKKLTVGVSSILLGLTFAGVTNAHADTNTPVNSNSESSSTVSSNQVINTSANTQVLKAAATSTAANSASSADVEYSVADPTSTDASSSAASQSSADTNAASAASSASDSSAAGDVKSSAADNYEAAVNAAVDATSASAKSDAAATTNDSNAASSATAENSAATSDQNSAAATAKDEDTTAKTPAPEEQLEVAPVQMTQYNAQPYSEAQREANAQAGEQIVNDFVSVFTSKTITGKIGAGINFVKDTINLISRHPLAYQRYQNMTARQMRYANRQHDLALKEIRMKKAHKPQWQINFVVWQQRQLSNWQHNLEIQRQTMIGYLKADVNASAAFA